MAPLIGIRLSAAMIIEMWILAFLIGVALTSLGIAIAARMVSMQGFQMIMNFLVMPLYFLSGAMFPSSTAPSWMKGLMVVDPGLVRRNSAHRGRRLPFQRPERVSVMNSHRNLRRFE